MEHTKQTAKSGPVTVSISRKIKPGLEEEYKQWEKAIIAEAATFPGYMGTNFIRPHPSTENKFILIYRYDSYENANRWEHSEVRKRWLEVVEPLLTEEPVKQKVTGLEVWFDLPEISATKPAPRYKMAIVLTVVLYVLGLSVNYLLQPVLEPLPWQADIFIVLIINVILMTYVIMPKLTYLLRNWLYH